MPGSVKLGLIIVGSILLVGITVNVLRWTMSTLSWMLSMLIPVAIVGGVILVLYGVASSRRSISDRRRNLP